MSKAFEDHKSKPGTMYVYAGYSGIFADFVED